MTAHQDKREASNAENLKGLYLATVRHMVAVANSEPGSLNAAQLESLRRFLADQGVNAQTLEGLDRLDPEKRDASLAEIFKDYDGDNYA